ncbi:MAG: MBL fold metallo-hydrolase [Oscillospiraceae bacterium]|nr:MBL fold metallo-hydrolase [Oscillospiraceae bacterium]MBR0392696.1 MBL fold metallo-hydrolase [Oscillospiraceae bacterium]
MGNSVTILGTRGSGPVSGEEYSRYGGATSCVLVEIGGRHILLDAGTGLLKLPPSVGEMQPIPLLLTHLHLDHLIGLPLCPQLFRDNIQLALYCSPGQLPLVRESLERLFSPPFWPVCLSDLPASVKLCSIPEDGCISGIRVETMPGVHPGGVTLYRLHGCGKTLVYASDCTLTEPLIADLADFARDCDLLLIDGQYSDEEWEAHCLYGHSRWTDAARLGQRCGAHQVRIVHHAPAHTDFILDAAEEQVRRICPVCTFAKEDEVICL